MGKRLAERPKLTFAKYNRMIDEYIAKGMTEDEAIAQTDKDIDEQGYVLDMEDTLNQALRENSSIGDLMLLAMEGLKNDNNKS